MWIWLGIREEFSIASIILYYTFMQSGALNADDYKIKTLINSERY